MVGALRPKVLAIEDDLEAVALIERSLGSVAGLRTVGSLSEARAVLTEDPPDLVILDLGLPDGDGLGFCDELRGAPFGFEMPIIFLTACTDLATKLAAFSLGADDYMPKPFEPAELRARVEARLRGTRATRELRVGPLWIRTDRQEVRLGSSGAPPLSLTRQEYRVLLHLAQHPEQVFSRRELIAAVWSGSVVDTRTVDTHIGNLRRKLGQWHWMVGSIRGVGYRFSHHGESAPL